MLSLASENVQSKALGVERDAIKTVCGTFDLLASRQHPSQVSWPSSTSVALTKEQDEAIDTLTESKNVSLLGLTNAQADKKKAWLNGLKNGIAEPQFDPRAPEGITSIWTQTDVDRILETGQKFYQRSFIKELEEIDGLCKSIKASRTTAEESDADQHQRFNLQSDFNAFLLRSGEDPSSIIW